MRFRNAPESRIHRVARIRDPIRCRRCHMPLLIDLLCVAAIVVAGGAIAGFIGFVEHV